MKGDSASIVDDGGGSAIINGVAEHFGMVSLSSVLGTGFYLATRPGLNIHLCWQHIEERRLKVEIISLFLKVIES